jgi:hypothetical protein
MVTMVTTSSLGGCRTAAIKKGEKPELAFKNLEHPREIRVFAVRKASREKAEGR